MTSQVPDEVRYRNDRYAITAVDGTGLFDPAADHGVTPGPIGTACWRGYHCRYRIRQGRLLLDDVHIGRVSARHDRSAALAAARDRIGKDGLRPAPGEPTSEWIHRTFSLGFDYSWPG